MTDELPLFPLGTVLFPGLVLPLHVFEERYRALVRRLTDRPEGEPREFGVVAIERGWEVDHHAGSSTSLTLHQIGCTAQIRQVTEHPDGQFDLVTVGHRRFRIEQVDADAEPYLVAKVTWLDEPEDSAKAADRLVPGVLELFQRYLRLMRPDREGEQLPEDATVLSHLVAATTALPLADRQALLASPDTTSRLRAERAMLHREVALLQRVRAVPVPMSELAVSTSPN
ncbi:LON peptidase substrate-binding domain-containing protein [Rugosimonospora acidiphila]|uniref:LON peptidase substrate-binding domain-containing protein n=1 Tax=Rugosimonospora acidiphila TaxID=556531 RepID=A0ABP9SKQ0_9ACTN